uniref:AIG1-type G domain-containing protein n=1 Tax=Oryza nivara TaxID=4536 RepID=A0A0E0H9Q2_ORYNI
MASTTDADAAPVAPVLEEKPPTPPPDGDEVPSAPAAAAAAEQPKVVEEEEVRLEGKGGGFGGQEVEVAGDGEDGGEVEVAEAKDEGGGGEFAGGDAKAASSLLAAAAEEEEEEEASNGELGEEDAYPASSDAAVGEEKGELGEEPEEKAPALAPEANGAAESDVEEKPEEDNEGEEVATGGGDDGELGMEKEVDVSAGAAEAPQPEDKVAPEAEANGDLGDKAEEEASASAAVEVVEESNAPEELLEKAVVSEANGVAATVELAVEEKLEDNKGEEEEMEAKPEPVSGVIPVVVDDTSSETIAPVSAESAVEESTEKEQTVDDTSSEMIAHVSAESAVEESTEKEQTVESEASESVEIVGVEKPSEDESNVDGGASSVVSRELAPEETKENNVGQEDEGVAEVIDREEDADDDEEIVLAAADDEDDGTNEADDDEDGVSSDRGPARVAIIESSEAAKQIMKELGEGSASVSPVSGLSSSREYTNSMDGQIVLDDSEEDGDDDDNEDDDEKGFDSAALAALLKAATGASADGNVTVSSQDGSRIFSMDRPAGLGSSAPSLRPTAPRPVARSNLFSPSELAVTAEPTEEMTEEEKKLHDKVELIRVKFLRLVYRLGATPEETVAAQVLYRLSLAEGIRHGRQTNRAFSLDNARKKAMLLEAEGKEELNFSCNILVLGKIGVGKSATINSIFGEEKSKTDAFSSATNSVREIVGNVDGVQIRIIDTPGLRPNVMDQGSNRKILASVKKYTKRCPPDIVLYVDRLDSLSRDLNDLPLLKTITSVLGSSIWFNAIVALTHAASAPPEGLNGAPMTYEVLMAQRSHIIQQSIRQAAGDMRLMNPVALVENHPSCRRNREGQKVLPNGQSWRHQMLLLCYSSKILSEANSLLKLQDPNPGKLFGFRFRSPPLPFLLSSLLQSRAHPKLSPDQGGNEGDSDIDLDDYSDIEQDEDEEEYDQLPPFKPLTKSQLARLTKEQKNAYFDEYDYRVKLLQKKQWKDEIRRLKEMKKRGKTDMDAYGYANITGENDLDPPPENVSVPLPDMVLPPSFDCDNPTYRYRFLEPTSTVLARPVLDAHGWDHDCGYDGVSVEETLALLNKFPANMAVQVTKDKKEFSIHLDSSISAKLGEDASSLAGFDIQTVGRQLAYILRGETKFKNIKKNKTTGGFSVTFLGDIVATGLKVEDQLSLGKRLALVASTGAMRAQGDTAYGANLEARLKDKDYPIGQSLSTLGLSLMKWRRDLALGANLQSQFSIGRGSKMAVRLGLNNKLSGQITVRTSTSEQVQIALLGLIPVAASIYRSFRPSEPSFAY